MKKHWILLTILLFTFILITYSQNVVITKTDTLYNQGALGVEATQLYNTISLYEPTGTLGIINTTDVDGQAQARWEQVFSVESVAPYHYIFDRFYLTFNFNTYGVQAIPDSNQYVLLYKFKNSYVHTWRSVSNLYRITDSTVTFYIGMSIGCTGYFTIGSLDTIGSPLPIELLSFNIKVENEVKITWETASEVNNNYFSIEHSYDGNNFEIIAHIKGAGNSNSYIKYNYIQGLPKIGTSYYRLKSIDFDGKVECSKTLAVTINKKSFKVKIYSIDGKLLYFGNRNRYNFKKT